MTSERLFNSFIPPKKFYTPKQISGYAPGNNSCLWATYAAVYDCRMFFSDDSDLHRRRSSVNIGGKDIFNENVRMKN